MARKVYITTARAAKPADAEMGIKIKARRVEIGMSQATLGEKLGITFQQIQKYEKGVNRISATRLTEIAKVLDIGTDYLMRVASKSESEFTFMITDASSQRLLRAFHKIEDASTRYKVVGLIEAITSHAA